jgi:hypothetical protein
MIHQHRHHDAFTHYLPYIILAVAGIVLIVLLAGLIPELSKIQLFPAARSALSVEPRQLDARTIGVAGSGYLLNRDRPVLGYAPAREFEPRTMGVAGSGYLLNRDRPVLGYAPARELDPRTMGVAGGGYQMNRDALVWGHVVSGEIDGRSLGVAGGGFLLNRNNP